MEQTERTEPKLVLVFSGKRKSGKDHVTDLLQTRLGPQVSCIVRLSGPLKQQFAQDHGLDLDLLLGPGPYKERFRSQMIHWGEDQRRNDPGFFCRLATRNATQPVWMVSDARRISDLTWFRTQYPTQTRSVRVQCSDQTRISRGWSFTVGVDDAESECGLDSGVDWDWIISNDGDPQDLEDQLRPVIDLALKAAS
ncbi:phosphomevalonate kinase [Boleophthalmus pectinirostris]|uniref:phosphomevalonate kinase n=1 Tax=Boleophthalmus pectinirostris TaxID=150288 RepID=UPI000A1C3F3E|nr:phosphomevalonate kinase [Boleophthalmus pectinirostris]